MGTFVGCGVAQGFLFCRWALWVKSTTPKLFPLSNPVKTLENSKVPEGHRPRGTALAAQCEIPTLPRNALSR